MFVAESAGALEHRVGLVIDRADAAKLRVELAQKSELALRCCGQVARAGDHVAVKQEHRSPSARSRVSSVSEGCDSEEASASGAIIGEALRVTLAREVRAVQTADRTGTAATPSQTTQ